MYKFIYCGYFFIALLILSCHATMPKNVVVNLTTVKGTIAIAPLETEPEYQRYSSIFRETLFTELARAKRLKLVERSQIDKVINEQGFQITGLVETKTAVGIGKLLGAEYFFVGTLRSADKDIFTINVRLISVEKGEVINGWSIDTSKKELPETARTMADWILRELIASLYPQPYTPFTTVLASTFVPGSGQLLNQRKSGYLFLPAGFFSALGVGLMQSALVSAQNEQDNAMRLSEYQRLGKDVNDKRRNRNITLGIAGAIWLINLIDSYLESRMEVQRYYQAIKTHYSEE